MSAYEQRHELEEKLATMLDALCDELRRDMAPALQARLSPEDVTQEVFVRASQSLQDFEYRDDAALAAWLRTIAHNFIRSEIRHRSVVPSERIAEALMESGALRPSQLTARAEALAALKQHLEKLDRRHQLVLQLRYVENLPFAEIGKTVSASDAAVRGLHRNALRQLANLFGSASRYFS